MTAIAGSIEEISFGGRIFKVPADNEAQLKLGGKENEVMANGDGATARLIQTAVPNGVNGLLLEIDHANGDLQFLQDRANAARFEVLSVTLADSSVYQGQAQIVGELQGSTQSATASVNFQGPGKLTLQ